MRLEVITPGRICVDAAADRIVAEAPDGHFGILPNHGDFVTELNREMQSRPRWLATLLAEFCINRLPSRR